MNFLLDYVHRSPNIHCAHHPISIPQDQKTVIRDNLCKRSDFECTPKKEGSSPEFVGTSRKYNPYEFINIKADTKSGKNVVEYIEVKKKNGASGNRVGKFKF